MADISFQLKLAEAVEKNPCIYDFQLKEYSNREKVQSAWQAVAQEVETSVKECRDTWRNLRIVFTRNVKQPPSGSKAKKKPWPLLQAMMFLKSYVTAKGNDLPGNLPSPPSQPLLQTDDSSVSETQGEEEPDQEGEETSRGNVTTNPRVEEIAPMGPPLKKRKKIQTPTADEIVVDYIKSKTMGSNDSSRKHFLMSLISEVEEMTTPQFKNFRREVVNLVDRILAPTPPAKLTSENSLFGYQQQQSVIPIATSSKEYSASSNQQISLYQPPLSTDFTMPDQDQIYTELAPYVTQKPL